MTVPKSVSSDSASNDDTNRFQDNLGCSAFTVCNLNSPFARDIEPTIIMLSAGPVIMYL